MMSAFTVLENWKGAEVGQETKIANKTLPNFMFQDYKLPVIQRGLS